MLRAKSFSLALVAVSCLSMAGCPAPTLPLPPPAVRATPPGADGMVAVTGRVLELAYVACLNEDLETGVITRADEEGAFSLQIRGRVGDQLTLWQIRGTEQGQNTYLTVPGQP